MSAGHRRSRLLPDAQWGLFLGCAVAAYAVPLLHHSRYLWQRDYFQFFPVLLGAILCLAWQRRMDATDLTRQHWHTGFVAAGLSLLTLGLYVYLNLPWLAVVSAFLLGEALLAELPDFRALWRALVILIPLPMGFDGTLVQKLQRLSSKGASAVLDSVHIDHLMSGNVLEFANRRLFVEEACSGVSSFYTLMAVSLLYVAATRPRTIVAVLLLVSVAWWSIVSNILRISTIAIAAAWYGVDLSEGNPHTILGCVVLGFSIAMIGSTLKLLRFFLDPISTPDGNVVEKSGSVVLTPITLWNLFTTTDREALPGTSHGRKSGLRLNRRRLLCVLSVLLVAASASNVLLARFSGSRPLRSPAHSVRVVSHPAFQSLGEDFFSAGRMQHGIVSFETVEPGTVEPGTVEPGTAAQVDDNSQVPTRIWTLQDDERQVKVSVSGPFRGWHDARSDFVSDTDDDQGSWRILDTEFYGEVVRVEMTNDQREHLSLFFCGFLNTAEKMPVPRDVSSGNVLQAVAGRMAEREDSDSDLVWQLQLSVSRNAAPLAAETAADRVLFDDCLRLVLKHWKDSP